MTHIRNDRTSRQRRRAGTALVLAAASGGLLAAIAGSPTARADDPYTDIVNDVQGSITIGQDEYSIAGTYFSTGDTNAGLAAELAGFDNTSISSTDYTLLGLTAAGTGTDFSGSSNVFFLPLSVFPMTAAGEQADASTYLGYAITDFTSAASALSGGDYFTAVQDSLLGGYDDVIAGQADSLAGLFSLGL